MPIIDHLLGNPATRKAIWKWWYPFLTRRLRDEGVVFLNYAFETSPPMAVPMDGSDEKNRCCAQLYHHVAALRDLTGKKVLEVSCGHGGGASYITRTFEPSSYTALDLNPTGIDYCRDRHQVEGLEFIQGDAEALPFDDASFDAVINVEASHCYPHFPKFLSEVERVLVPGGTFQYADFRFRESMPPWEDGIEKCALEVGQMTDISQNVLLGLDANSERSLELIGRKLPKFLHGLGRDFAGVEGSRIYRALVDGELVYRSYLMVKR